MKVIARRQRSGSQVIFKTCKTHGFYLSGVNKLIKNNAELFMKFLLNMVEPWPWRQKDSLFREEDFWNVTKFPHCLGAINGKHFCTHRFAASNYIFTFVDVGAHDSQRRCVQDY